MGCRRFPCELDDFLCIALKIPNRGVDLGESNLHFFSLSTEGLVGAPAWAAETRFISQGWALASEAMP
jgi:hypothetical protein